MTHFFKVSVFISALLIGFTACSSSEKAASTSSPAMYPAWYSTAAFDADSTSFHGFATAISTDSVVAIANAELQARTNLESAIAYKMEEVRTALEEEGNSTVTNSDFILTLRNAHNQVQETASVSNGASRSDEGYYRGYAKVSITKSDFDQLMKSAFSGKPDYWQLFSSSAAYADEMN
ncbi:hypothetical protein [Gracilimonas sediminicola]|uniref:LPP20 lipoprotein n=1 Tax=Gracilimonas sediminicola TaxID=2952158 RepID=A0A9X2L586_9BACT|nr:hypothetical protein [Gracilimonas sediminicola]MCP9292591.1 hypothetical protein [Gracilimonas sediminicola]